MKYYSTEEYENAQITKQPQVEQEFGCGFCWDKKRRANKELFFLDNANNMRVCSYCPACGRKYE